jgi:hypothetical protein
MACQTAVLINSPFQAFIVVFGTPSDTSQNNLDRLAVLAVATGTVDVCIELAAINLGRSFWKTGYLMICFAVSTMDRTPIP